MKRILLRKRDWTLTKDIFKRASAVRKLGFAPSFTMHCPWEGGPTGRVRGSVYFRGDQCVCVYCLHLWQESPDGPLFLDPKVVEEIGNAIFPPPTGFRLTGEDGGPTRIAPNV